MVGDPSEHPAISEALKRHLNDKSLDKDERKRRQVEHAKHLSADAALVKLADKITNIQDVAHNPPEGWSVERRQEYLDWAEEVVDNIPAPHTALPRAFNDALAVGRELLG